MILNSGLSIENFYQLIDLSKNSIFWKDRDGYILGCNKYMLNIFGIKERGQLIGKSEYDYLSEEDAKKIRDIDQQVMNGVPYQGHEYAEIDGVEKVYLVSKSQLFDEYGNVTGIIGTAIDITAEKEAERLKLESEKQKIELIEQEKFRQNAHKVAHDIRSPLTSLLILAKTCTAIPERERIALREAATSINDIANNLLSNYRKNEAEKAGGANDSREPILISPLLLQMLTEKKFQYQGFPVVFDHNFSQVGEFSWINIQPTAFKRTISNIINNAVDAFDQKEGKIILHLDADDREVRVTIEDNGKGMSQKLRQKIMDHIAVTEGKADGHGLGLAQVRETLQNNEGQWEIDSKVGAGTKIILTFPRTPALNWIAETVQLNENDTIVVLDDDRSIHMAWDLRFEKLMKAYPGLVVKHFSIGQDVVDFVCSMNAGERQGVFLLSDYELLEQKLNGLDVIEQTKIKRSILVTSHYAHKNIQKSAVQIGTKILPKQLASDVPIRVGEVVALSDSVAQNSERIKMDVVFVDDEDYLLESFKIFSGDKKVDTYQDPGEFLDKVDQYHRDTKIMLDQTFANYPKKGTEIAEQLNSMGFTRLYLLSGDESSLLDYPKYLMPILKTDLNTLTIVLNE